ncbi:MAG: hypothetical protein J6W09_03230 [Bacteroidales bacterium]|jgi:hypothetical protein|nr:hypothetical protein [Bacteroidales bacterium]
MEDFILKEIDRIGQMLMGIARKLGLLRDETPNYSLTDVKEEFAQASLPFDLDSVLQQENPVLYLVQDVKISDQGLEMFIDILFHSDLDEDRKKALLEDALTYLDRKGYFSFRLHALMTA